MSRIACLAGCSMPVPASTRDEGSGSMLLFCRLVVVALLCAVPAASQGRQVQRLPNFIIVFADDMGYADIGPFSTRTGAARPQTPNLDRMAAEGVRLTSFYYDILFELLDPKLVKFQFQMSTIGYGFVAADYFTKYPGRFISMHLQDVDLNATPPPPPPDAPARGGGRGRGRGVATSVGKGSIDWVKTFQAAKVGGVRNYFVEQNMDLTSESVAFLKTLKV
jgi:hypothetical protein